MEVHAFSEGISPIINLFRNVLLDIQKEIIPISWSSSPPRMLSTGFHIFIEIFFL